jgi:hypothetical protein
MAQPGLIDFSTLGDLPDVYAKGQERRQKDLFEQSLKGFSGDYNELVRRAAEAGYVPGLELASKLKQAEATNQYHLDTLAETKRQHDILAGQAMRPVIHWNPPDPFNPSAVPTGIMITHDKNGRIIDQRTITGGPGGAAPQQSQPPQQGAADYYWNSVPTQGLPGAGALGPRSDLQQPPGGPAYAQAPAGFPDVPSASDQLIAQAQQAQEPPGPQGPPLAQYAQAGGPSVSPPQPPAPAPAWMTGAQAPAVTLPRQGSQQQQEAPNPLGHDQRGTLRYTPPLGPFNEEVLAGQPKGMQEIVRGLVAGRVNPMAIPAKDGARLRATMLAHQYGPYDESFYSRRTRTMAGFGAGPGAVQGRTVTAINNLTEHLDTARDLIAHLENTQLPGLNAIINKWREQTGYNAELPGNLKAAAPIITGELMKVVAGAGGIDPRAVQILRTNPTPETRQYFKDTFKVDDAAIDKLLQGR